MTIEKESKLAYGIEYFDKSLNLWITLNKVYVDYAKADKVSEMYRARHGRAIVTQVEVVD